MLEAEVQSLVTLILGCGQVLQLLLLRHRVPLLVPGLVAPYVIDLHQEIEADVAAENA